jgi:hypothetical protein
MLLGSLTSFFFFFLSFSSSCLVSSSFSEVWQFEFPYCPQVPENSSVAHQPFCFVAGCLLCWFIGGSLPCLTPFLWGKVGVPSAGSLLSACYDGLLIAFQFFRAILLWVLFTGSEDELCGLLSALFHAAVYHLPTVSHSAFPDICLLKVYMEISFLLLPPSPLCLQHHASSAVCYFSVPCLFNFLFCFVFLCRAECQSSQGAMMVYPRGG